MDYLPRDYLVDFRNFVSLLWERLGLPSPTPFQYSIARFLQYGPDESKSPWDAPNDRILIEAFRGAAKSWLTSAFVQWALLPRPADLDHMRLGPHLNILVVSAAKNRADDFSTFVHRCIAEIPELAVLSPLDHQRQSKIAFDVGPAPAMHMPSVKSLGITGQMTGSRADIIVGDDMEVPNNSQTHAMREVLRQRTTEFESILKPGGRQVVLATPQHEETLCEHLVEAGFTRRIWPVRYPDGALLVSYGPELAPLISEALETDPALEGHSTEPTRFDDEDLLERELSMGRSNFRLQFLLDTSMADADRHPLRLSDLIALDLDPEVGPERVVWARDPELVDRLLPNVGLKGDRWYNPVRVKGVEQIPYKGVVMAVDPAGRGKDETGYAVVANTHSQLFLLEAGGLPGGYDEASLRTLAETARDFKVNEIVVEANFGDGMFTQLLLPILRQVYPVHVEEVKHFGTQKELRIIDTLEPVLNRHRLIVNRGMIERDARLRTDVGQETAPQYQLFHQLTRITRQRGALKHDDRLEAVAMAVGHWSERMAQDVDQAVKDRREDVLDAELRKMMDHFDRKPKGLVETFLTPITGRVERRPGEGPGKTLRVEY